MNGRHPPSSRGYLHLPEVKSYGGGPPFDPPGMFPEWGDLPRGTNAVYGAVRSLLEELGLDRENRGTTRWNPLGDIVEPGDRVLLKPNLVTHRHYLGREALFGSVVHGAFLRPVVDYALKALDGRGLLTIADCPVEGADFEALMDFTGIRVMVDTLRSRGHANLELVDLRPRRLRDSSRRECDYEELPGDPLGYVEVNLGTDSLFSALDDRPDNHYYTLADASINHFDPTCVRESVTDRYHHKGSHRYLVAKSVLTADVILNISKMKTHCKAGVSMALKNMIGMVYLKECMPHHRPGTPPLGDSFPAPPAASYTASRRIYRSLRESVGVHRLPGFRALRNLMQRKGILVGQHVEHGNWKGNDTIWRTILDLNRIAAYGRSDGTMSDKRERRSLCLIDGIVAQQGEGPMSGDPVAASLIVGAFSPVVADALAVRLMGLEWGMFPSIAGAGDITRWPLLPVPDVDLAFKDVRPEGEVFLLPRGWH